MSNAPVALLQEIFGWLLVAAFAAGIVGIALGYRIRDGRRENMLVSSLKHGRIGGLAAILILVPIVLILAWLRS